MLIKLMKYEFKANSRLIISLFGAMIAMSIVNRLLDLLNRAADIEFLFITNNFSHSLSLMLIIATWVTLLFITIQRFNKSVLQKEGYLTHTLPVSTEKIILSRLFVASIWYIIGGIVAILSVVILTNSFNFSDIKPFLNGLFVFENLRTLIELIVCFVLAVFCALLLLYACLSLGMLANSHRALLSFGAFWAISTMMQLLFSITLALMSTVLFRATNWALFPDGIHVALLIMICFLSIFCVIFFLITRNMLRYKLNLR
ncbi:MAG: hypothetical protein FWH42_00450 [Dehalococcoidia bacterium]|nr:hypothetical protein [Dehalococcoidia bacterium]